MRKSFTPILKLFLLACVGGKPEINLARFDVLRRHLGISRKVLTTRLYTLVEHEILERVLDQQNPDKFEYRLTEQR